MAYDSTKPATGGPLVAADIRENYRALKEDGIVLPKTGTGATDACAGNDARLSNQRVPTNASVSQAKLKTSIGSVSNSSSAADRVLPGGQYGFYPQIKMATTEPHGTSCLIAREMVRGGWTTYRSNITLYVSGETLYAQQRYVTSSGEVFWIFILRDKITKEIISMYQAPDHPCFGNGGKPLLVPHPFSDYDETKHEIIVINPSHEEVEAMKRMGERGEDEPDKDLLEVIMEEYEIDEDSKPAWPTIPVTVGLPKDYETKQMGENIQPVKKVIPKPDGMLVRSLRKRTQ